MSKSDSSSNKHSLKNENPCWKGYEPIGTKEKDGKTVPNCVPKNDSSSKSKKKS